MRKLLQVTFILLFFTLTARAQCSGDGYEPNNTFSTASGRALPFTIQATIHNNADGDYYRVTVPKGQLKINLTNLPADYDLALYYEYNVPYRGPLPLAYSTNRGTTDESITCFVDGGDYYISVYGYKSANSCQEYTLSAQFIDCADEYERNDNFSKATPLSIPSNIQASIHTSSDVDYYSILTPSPYAGGAFKINLTNLPANYDLKIYNSSHQELGSSTKSGSTDESITCPASPDNGYYIKVYGKDGANSCQKYLLSIQFAFCKDPYEDNDNFNTATNLVLPSNLHATIHNGVDVDFYRVTIPATSQLKIDLTNLVLDCDLVLYNSANVMVASSTNWGGYDESITYGGPAGNYYIKVFGYAGANSCKAYKLSTQLVSCPDAYEPNNSITAANNLTPPSYVLPICQAPVQRTGTIHTPGDVDYYKVEVQCSKYLKIYLQNLPANYDVKLFKSNNLSATLCSSINTGTGNKFMSYYASPGTYYIQVNGYNGANSCAPYLLRVETSSTSASKFAGGSEGDGTEDHPAPVAWSSERLFNISPNPSSGDFSIDYTSAVEGPCSVSVIDINGRVSKVKQVELAAGKNKIAISIADLPAGSYMIRLTTAQDTQTGKLLLQK